MRLLILTILILAQGLLSCAGLQSQALNRAFADEVEASEKLVQASRFKQAIDELSMLLEMDSKNERARFLRAFSYQNLHKFDLAIQDYEEILKQNPKADKSHYNLGMLHAFKLNNPDKALFHFDKFLTLNPHHKEAFRVAKIMSSIDERAPEEIQHAAESQKLMGQALQCTEAKEKRKLLMSGIKLAPNSPVFYYLVGQTFEAEGKNGEAIKYYEESIERRPTCARCNRSLGNLLIQQDSEEEGSIYLRKAQLFAPNEE